MDGCSFVTSATGPADTSIQSHRHITSALAVVRGCFPRTPRVSSTPMRFLPSQCATRDDTVKLGTLSEEHDPSPGRVLPFKNHKQHKYQYREGR